VSSDRAQADDAAAVLRSVRVVLAQVVRDRLIIVWAFLACLGVWAVSITNQALSGNLLSARPHAEDLGTSAWPWILWLFVLAEGLSLLFYFSGRRRLAILDGEIGASGKDPTSFRAEFRAVASLDGRFAEVQRTRDHNVGFGIIASMIVLWSGFPLLYGVQNVSIQLFGVWWITPFVGVVALVWIGLSLLHRGAVSRLRENIQRFTDGWVPPAPSRPNASGQAESELGSSGESAPRIEPNSPEIRALKARDSRVLGRARAGLLAVSLLVVFGGAILGIGSALSFSAHALSGGWVNYLFLTEAIGTAPALLLAAMRLAEAEVRVQTPAVESTTARSARPDPIASKIAEIRIASSTLFAARRIAETSMVVASYGAVWLSLGILYVYNPPQLGAVLLIGNALALAIYLPLWFNRVHTLVVDEYRVHGWVDSLLDVELDFWSQY
jgi:hypothetical protein